MIRCSLVARRLALAFGIALPVLPAMPAHVAAQQTQTEEMERRARVLSTLPADAAKRHFGSVKLGTAGDPRVIGSYAKGCLAGASAISADGPSWQVMRPSRNRAWGHPALIATVQRIAQRARGVGWNGLLVGDISQPRGGPMLTGHASHQVGLDADLWLTPMPGRSLSTSERENMSATNVVAANWMDVDPAVWTDAHRNIIKLAAQDPGIVRIFVNPAIKVALCRNPGGDRSWLSKVRPMWSHNYHFHIRMACPAGDAACQDQDPPPDGDGCGAELQDWLKRQHKALFGPKKPRPDRPARVLPLSAMPAACQQIVLTR